MASGRDRPGLDFSQLMIRVCQDLCARLEQLSHVDMRRVAVGFVQARVRSSYGTYATLTPMRFADGALRQRRRGRWYTVQRLFDASGAEMLYILNFYLPRFLDLPFEEKLVTVCHELWHISPRFDGDIRRFAGRCYAHSGSQKDFDRQADQLARQWLQLNPSDDLLRPLRFSFSEIRQNYGGLYGVKYRHPKLIALS